MSDREENGGAEIVNLADARRRLRVGEFVERHGLSHVMPVPGADPNSKRDSLEQKVSAVAEEKRQRRECRRLAEALLLRAGIPNGSALVILLGDGTEHDNRDVMCRWVYRNRHLMTEASQLGVDLLDHLYRRLQRDFEERMGVGG